MSFWAGYEKVLLIAAVVGLLVLIAVGVAVVLLLTGRKDDERRPEE